MRSFHQVSDDAQAFNITCQRLHVVRFHVQRFSLKAGSNTMIYCRFESIKSFSIDEPLFFCESAFKSLAFTMAGITRQSYRSQLWVIEKKLPPLNRNSLCGKYCAHADENDGQEKYNKEYMSHTGPPHTIMLLKNRPLTLMVILIVHIDKKNLIEDEEMLLL
jgi:hypothetical protein